MPVDNRTGELPFVAVTNLLWQSWQDISALLIRNFAGGAFLLVALHHLHNEHGCDVNTAMMHACQQTADSACGGRGIQECACCMVDTPYGQHAARCF